MKFSEINIGDFFVFKNRCWKKIDEFSANVQGQNLVSEIDLDANIEHLLDSKFHTALGEKHLYLIFENGDVLKFDSIKKAITSSKILNED